MRTQLLLLAALALSCGAARADLYVDPNAPVSAPAPATAAEPSAADARVMELQKRFAAARAVENQGQFQQALALFDGIIKDAPDAKGSLLEAGKICQLLGDNARADDYYSKLHVQAPEYAAVIESLIQVNQALKRDVKVEIMIDQLRKLWESGKAERPYFVREHIKLDTGAQIEITQFFDYHQKPFIAWLAEYVDPQGNLKRQLSVNYDPEVTATMRKDPKLANAEQFLVVDNVGAPHVTRLDVYQQFLALPDYTKMRTILLEIFANGLKAIDSAPVPQQAGQ